MKKGLGLAGVVFVVCSLGGGLTQAQEGGMQKREGPQPGLKEHRAELKEQKERRAELQEQMEILKTFRMMKALSLSKDEALDLLSGLDSIKEKRQKLNKERMEILNQTEKCLNEEKPDEGKLKKQLRQLDDIKASLRGLETEEADLIKDRLSIKQQAEYFIFKKNFRKTMQRLIGKARGRREAERSPQRPQREARERYPISP